MKQGLWGPCFFCLLFLVGEHLGDEVEELKNSLQLSFFGGGVSLLRDALWTRRLKLGANLSVRSVLMDNWVDFFVCDVH